jgi:hypothetical protein
MQHPVCGMALFFDRSSFINGKFNKVFFLFIYFLERGPLSLVRIIEELLERKVAAPV